MRSMYLAACAALCFAAETGSGSGSRKGDAPSPTIDELTAQVAELTQQRDEAMKAGAEAIGELQATIDDLTEKLKQSDAAKADAETRVGNLSEELDKVSANAVRAERELDRLRDESAATLDLRPVDTGPKIVEGHYVLTTSKVSADDVQLPRGRIVRAGVAKAGKLAAKGHLRPATETDLERNRHEIVSL